MLKNYFLIAFRNLRKHRFYSFINVVGFSIGGSVCLVIVLFVANELSYDHHHVNADRIIGFTATQSWWKSFPNAIRAPAWVTMSFQSFRDANSSPVDSLRSE